MSSTFEERAAMYIEKGYWRKLSLFEELKNWTSQYSSNIAIVSGEQRITYAELYQKSQELAGGILNLGIVPGDRVIVQLPNISEFLILCFALFRIGVIPVLTLPASRENDIYALCQISGATGYIGVEEYLNFEYSDIAKRLVKSLNVKHIISAKGKLPFATDINDLYMTPPDIVYPNFRDIALLLLSGGTTGTPKLIPRTHTDYSYCSRTYAGQCGLSTSTAYLTVLPAAHNFPLTSPGMLGTFSCGGKVVLQETPAPDESFSLIEKEKITITGLVPSLLKVWLENRKWDMSDLSSLKIIIVGGEKVDPNLIAQVKPEFGACPIQGFGTAEGLNTHTNLTDTDEVLLTTQGKPISEDDEIIFIDESGNIVDDSIGGEMLTRGPYTIQGYYNLPEINKLMFTEDGFYKTGDLGKRRPDGNILITGRIKEQINRAGEKISPIELENYICEIPQVESAAVVGLPDPDLGEKICAVIISQDTNLDLFSIHNFLELKGVARYKFPDQLELVESFPHTNVGKVDKKALIKKLTNKSN